MPLLTGNGRSNHGQILAKAAAMSEAGRLTPMMNERQCDTDEIAAAFSTVAAGSLGRVVVKITASWTRCATINHGIAGINAEKP
jgi:NADPH2:quinone reductase